MYSAQTLLIASEFFRTFSATPSTDLPARPLTAASYSMMEASFERSLISNSCASGTARSS